MVFLFNRKKKTHRSLEELSGLYASCGHLSMIPRTSSDVNPEEPIATILQSIASIREQLAGLQATHCEHYEIQASLLAIVEDEEKKAAGFTLSHRLVDPLIQELHYLAVNFSFRENKVYAVTQLLINRKITLESFVEAIDKILTAWGASLPGEDVNLMPARSCLAELDIDIAVNSYRSAGL